MNQIQPIFDPAARYRIEVRGQVDREWLQSFDRSIELLVEEPGQRQEYTVIEVHADQSGMIGLLRRLHGLGMTILLLQLVTGKESE